MDLKLIPRLQVTYRSGPPKSHVSQLSLYSAYKTRFDPHSAASPLMGGEEYSLSGIKERDGSEGEWEKSLEGFAEPVRASTW
jgi:hypothetical protein